MLFRSAISLVGRSHVRNCIHRVVPCHPFRYGPYGRLRCQRELPIGSFSEAGPCDVAKADAEGDLKDTTTTRDADVKYLADLTATCEQKASDFEARQQLRAEEIVAIEKAI